MFLRLKNSKNSKHPTAQIVEGVREGKKVRQKVIASLGVVKNQEDLIKFSKLTQSLTKLLEKEGFVTDPKIVLADLRHADTIFDGFSFITAELLELTGFAKILQSAQGRHSFDLSRVAQLIIAERLNRPSSKLRTYERQEELGFFGLELQHFYRAMDAVEPLSANFQKQAYATVCAYSQGPVDCFFFDVTTLYFESVVQDEPKDLGLSKDQEQRSVQIVFALVVDSQGLPLAYDLFEGSLVETKTLIPVLNDLKSRFSVKNVTVVCDRSMGIQANIEALQKSGFHFAIATSLKSIAKKNKINDRSTYVPLPGQEHLSEDEKILFKAMPHPQYADTLLIATYSPYRAKKDQFEREQLLQKLREKLDGPANTVALRKMINNSAYKKYLSIQTNELLALNEAAIIADAEWDGFHGIAISNSANLTQAEALEYYCGLWYVEETFRVAKYSLRTRPMFHWAPRRIRSHVLFCFLTLFLERFLEFLLKQNNTPLTPDRISYALSKAHTILVKEKEGEKSIKIESILSEDLQKIFCALNIPTQRITSRE